MTVPLIDTIRGYTRKAPDCLYSPAAMLAPQHKSSLSLTGVECKDDMMFENGLSGGGLTRARETKWNYRVSHGISNGSAQTDGCESRNRSFCERQPCNFSQIGHPKPSAIHNNSTHTPTLPTAQPGTINQTHRPLCEFHHPSKQPPSIDPIHPSLSISCGHLSTEQRRQRTVCITHSHIASAHGLGTSS